MSKTKGPPNIRSLPIPAAGGPPLVRKPIYLLNQQLGDPGRAMALGLLPERADGYEVIDDPSGIRLSYAAGRLLDGILKIYESTGRDEATGRPLGHAFTTRVDRHETPYGVNLVAVKIPVLHVTERELLEAYEATPRGGRYNRSARETVRAAIWELHKATHDIYYKQKEGRGKKAKESIVRLTGSLFTVTRVDYFDGPINNREGADPRATWYEITPNSILLNGISSFYILSSVNKYQEIDAEVTRMRGTRAGRKGSYYNLLIDYLQTLNTPDHKISLKRLAEKLRLDYLAKNRKATALRGAIGAAAEVAYNLGYLLEPMVIAGPDEAPICYFKLDPAKCTRVKKGKSGRG